MFINISFTGFIVYGFNDALQLVLDAFIITTQYLRLVHGPPLGFRSDSQEEKVCPIPALQDVSCGWTQTMPTK